MTTFKYFNFNGKNIMLDSIYIHTYMDNLASNSIYLMTEIVPMFSRAIQVSWKIDRLISW